MCLSGNDINKPLSEFTSIEDRTLLPLFHTSYYIFPGHTCTYKT